MAWTKKVKERIREQLYHAGVSEESVTFSKKGHITAKVAFFYRHGKSHEKLAAAITQHVPDALITEAFEDWKAWPKTSYFVVRFILSSGWGFEEDVPVIGIPLPSRGKK